MNRILMITTALVMSAAAAQAEVTLSGDARMGIIKDFPPLGEADNQSLEFTSRARVKFDLTGTTDGGLKFGASFRASDAASATIGDAGEVYISGEWGRLSMGDVDSAALSAVDQVSAVGLTDLSNLNEIRYIANGFDGTDPSVLYSYRNGDWTFYASVVNPGSVRIVSDLPIPSTTNFSLIDSEDGIQAYSVAVRYKVENYAVALGYESNNIVFGPGLVVDQQNLMLGVEAQFDKLRLQAIVGHFEGSDVFYEGPVGTQLNNLSGTQFAISADYAVSDELTLTAFYADDSQYDGTKAYGVGAAYDLGGGATVKGGIVKDKADGATAYDFGVAMSF